MRNSAVPLLALLTSVISGGMMSHAQSSKGNAPAPLDLQLVPGAYPLTWDTSLVYDSVPRECATKGLKPQTILKKLPHLVSGRAMYMAFREDGSGRDGLIHVVFDESTGTGKGYDTACIDANRNGDFRDDKPVRWKPQLSSYTRSLPWITVRSHQGAPGGRQTHSPIQVQLTVSNQRGFDAWIRRKGCWKGTVDSNKGKIAFLAADANLNGAFSDRSWGGAGGEAHVGDVMYADINGSGGLSFGSQSPHRLYANEANVIGGKLYKIGTSDVGDTVTIERYTGPSGALLVQGADISGVHADVTALCITGQSGIYSVNGCDGQSVPLPAGTYRIVSCMLQVRRDSRDTFDIYWDLDKAAEIRPDQQTALALTDTMTGAVALEQKEIVLQAGQISRFSWMLSMQGGGGVRGVPDTGSPSGPKVEFLDGEGRLVSTSTAPYT